jgi:hypothetical protein
MPSLRKNILQYSELQRLKLTDTRSIGTGTGTNLSFPFYYQEPNNFNPDVFGPDPTFEKNRIRIRPLTKMRIRILLYVKFCTTFLKQEVFAIMA